MALANEMDRRTPEEIRNQLATQVQVDDHHLAGVLLRFSAGLLDQLATDEVNRGVKPARGASALTGQIKQVRMSAAPELTLAFAAVDGLKFVDETRGHSASA